MHGDLPAPGDEVARLVTAARAGDETARDRLAALVYDELKRLARGYMRRERPGVTLQPTALVHDAWMRLMGSRNLDAGDRAHFVGLAARTMRQLLVERARARRAQKRGADPRRVTISDDMIGAASLPIDIEAIDEALTRLAAEQPGLARLVELRFFGGLSIEQTADALGVSPATLKRRWTLARAWLARELEGAPGR